MLIVMEYMVNGSLLRYMRNGEGKNFNFKDIINIAAQIADGMKYLVYQFNFLFCSINLNKSSY
jgi:serine/threonine protein kinase